MQVKLEDRPIEQVREETIDTLIYSYSHAVISEDAFERRLDVIIKSQDHLEIVKQVEDLPLADNDTIKQHRDQSFSVQIDPTAEQDTGAFNAILSSNEKTGRWVVPAYIKCTNIMGTLKLDFSNAIFTSAVVHIEVLSIMGTETFFVPETVNVTTSVNNFMSSVKDRAASMAGKQAPQIKITGTAIMSTTSVKHKRTMKEQFMAFANDMKKMFDFK